MVQTNVKQLVKCEECDFVVPEDDIAAQHDHLLYKHGFINRLDPDDVFYAKRMYWVRVEAQQ